MSVFHSVRESTCRCISQTEENTDKFYGVLMTNFRYEELTYQLRGLIFEARRRLKTGWTEEVYHRGMVQLLQDKSVPFYSKPRKTIVHQGVEVKKFEADLIVWDTIILELKALPFATFAPGHYAQIIHYLKCWDKNLGLLVNFGPTRAQIKRVVWDEPELEIVEDYDSIKSIITDTERVPLRQIRESILDIGRQYGLGYPETMYWKIIAIELAHIGLGCQTHTQITIKWGELDLANFLSDHLLVENSYLLNICSLFEHPPKYEFARTKTYLNSLGLRFGLLINFGKKQLQIYGVSSD